MNWLFQPLPEASGNVSAHILTADSGAFALTGQAATLFEFPTITAAVGSFSLTGQDAGLLNKHLLTAAQASYALTGNDAGILQTTVLADIGQYTITGSTATLVYTRFTADLGSFTLSGQSAALVRRYTNVAAFESFLLTGQATGLLYSHISAAVSGSFVLTGEDAGLRQTAYQMVAGGVEFELAGIGAAFNILGAMEIVASLGSFALAGEDAGLTKAGILVAAGESYLLDGEVASLQFGRALEVDTGTYLLTGVDIRIDLTAVLEGGVFALLGQDVEFSRTNYMPADTGLYDLSVFDSDSAAQHFLALAAADFVFTGNDILFDQGSHTVTPAARTALVRAENRVAYVA